MAERLIDANKLIEICRKGWKLFGREDEKLKHWVDEDDIRNQPTVEAIPIERIKSKIDAVLGDYPDGNEETEILCKLLYDWEKENGKAD